MLYGWKIVEDNALTKLISLGVEDFAHINGNLLSHLKGTKDLLSKWGNREALCNAGLYHSIYGTQGYKKQSSNDRTNIINIIGEEAEKIIFYFSTCDREHFYPQIGYPELKHRNRLNEEIEVLDESMVKDLLELTLANELEILMKLPPPLTENWKILFERFKNYVSDAGFQEYLRLK